MYYLFRFFQSKIDPIRKKEETSVWIQCGKATQEIDINAIYKRFIESGVPSNYIVISKDPTPPANIP